MDPTRGTPHNVPHQLPSAQRNTAGKRVELGEEEEDNTFDQAELNAIFEKAAHMQIPPKPAVGCPRLESFPKEKSFSKNDESSSRRRRSSKDTASRKDTFAQRGIFHDEFGDKTLDEENSTIFDNNELKSDDDRCGSASDTPSFPDYPIPPQFLVPPAAVRRIVLSTSKSPPKQSSSRRIHHLRPQNKEKRTSSQRTSIRSDTSMPIKTFAKREAYSLEDEDKTLDEANDSIFEQVGKQYERERGEVKKKAKTIPLYHVDASKGLVNKRSVREYFPDEDASRIVALARYNISKGVRVGVSAEPVSLMDIDSVLRTAIWLVLLLIILVCLGQLGVHGTAEAMKSLAGSLSQIVFGAMTVVYLVICRLLVSIRLLLNVIVCDFKDQACTRMDVFCDNTCQWIHQRAQWLHDVAHDKNYW